MRIRQVIYSSNCKPVIYVVGFYRSWFLSHGPALLIHTAISLISRSDNEKAWDRAASPFDIAQILKLAYLSTVQEKGGLPSRLKCRQIGQCDGELCSDFGPSEEADSLSSSSSANDNAMTNGNLSRA
jgi:hypothetical protein